MAPLEGVERRLATIQPRWRPFNRVQWPGVPIQRVCSLATPQAAAAGRSVCDCEARPGEKRQLTRPHGLVRDTDPAISPDGRHLMFRRDTTPFSGQFFRVALDARFVPNGEPCG